MGGCLILPKKLGFQQKKLLCSKLQEFLSLIKTALVTEHPGGEIIRCQHCVSCGLFERGYAAPWNLYKAYNSYKEGSRFLNVFNSRLAALTLQGLNVCLYLCASKQAAYLLILCSLLLVLRSTGAAVHSWSIKFFRSL